MEIFKEVVSPEYQERLDRLADMLVTAKRFGKTATTGGEQPTVGIPEKDREE